jgi:hypothetical protein
MDGLLSFVANNWGTWAVLSITLVVITLILLAISKVWTNLPIMIFLFVLAIAAWVSCVFFVLSTIIYVIRFAVRTAGVA